MVHFGCGKDRVNMYPLKQKRETNKNNMVYFWLGKDFVNLSQNKVSDSQTI